MPLNIFNTMPTGDDAEFVADFEAWADEQGFDLSPPPEGESGRYGDEDTARAFSVWLAASSRVDSEE